MKKRTTRNLRPRKEKRKFSFIRGRREKLGKLRLTVIIVLAILIIAFYFAKGRVFAIYHTPSPDMEPTLIYDAEHGDRLLVLDSDWVPYRLGRWDVAVFKTPRGDNRNHYDGKAGRWLASMPGERTEGETRNLKRVVGLPGETVAVNRGDVWTKPDGGEYRRQVKPHRVQDAMWCAVYETDFADLSLDEFLFFWERRGDGTLAVENGELLLSPGAGRLELSFLPKARAGEGRGELKLLPGIADRYFPAQLVDFSCRRILPDGGVCGELFSRTVRTPGIQVRCPKCGGMAHEDAATFYLKDSGLAGVGPFAADSSAIRQGQAGALRQNPYFAVPDLRVVAELAFSDPAGSWSAVFHEDGQTIELTLGADGRVEMRVDGGGPEVIAHAGGFTPGKWRTVEFHLADGMARVFLDGSGAPLVERLARNEPIRSLVEIQETSGVGLAAAGGGVRLRRVSVDRDVFYFNGMETLMGRFFRGKPATQDETRIGPDSFYVLGDQTFLSLDSRFWNPIHTSYLRGRVYMIVWPRDRIGRIAPR